MPPSPNIPTAMHWFRGIGWQGIFPVMGKQPIPGFHWKTQKASENEWSSATGLALIVPRGVVVVDIDSHITGCPGKQHPKEPSDEPREPSGSLAESSANLSTISVAHPLAHPRGCTCAPPSEIAAKFPQTPLTVHTPSGGIHLYYRDPSNLFTCTTKTVNPQVDTKANGDGYVLLPPSLHPSGGTYVWGDLDAAVEIGFDFMKLPVAPEFLYSAFRRARSAKGEGGGLKELFKRGAATGERNSMCAKVAGHLWWAFAPGNPVDVNDESLGAIVAALVVWNRRVEPPLRFDELESVAKSIGRTHYGRLKGKGVGNNSNGNDRGRGLPRDRSVGHGAEA